MVTTDLRSLKKEEESGGFYLGRKEVEDAEIRKSDSDNMELYQKHMKNVGGH